MEEKFVRAVVRVALLFAANKFMGEGTLAVAKQWEKWVWGEEDGSKGNDR